MESSPAGIFAIQAEIAREIEAPALRPGRAFEIVKEE
jgi:hypothetical protein